MGRTERWFRRSAILFAMSVILTRADALRAQECRDAALTVGRAVGTPGATVSVELRGNSFCQVNGFGLAIGHDLTRVRFSHAKPGPFLVEHAGSDLFFQPSAAPDVDYITLLVVFDLSLPLTVPATRVPVDTLLATLFYDIRPEAEPGEVILRNEDETFGNPPVANIFTTERLEIRPRLESGAITIPDLRPRFVRGDVNADGSANLSDAGIVVLHLFASGPEPPCMKAADLDDNGSVNLSDAVRLLNHLFVAGIPPEAPLGECGPDPTEDDLTCESFPLCE